MNFFTENLPCPWLVEISWAINQSPILTLHRYLLGEGERTGLLFLLPFHCPSASLALGEQSCRPSDFCMVVFTVIPECCCCSAACSAMSDSL